MNQESIVNPNPASAEIASPQSGSASPVYSYLAEDPMLNELVDLFVQEMPDRISAFERQARNKDWSQLARTAHQTQGLGRQLWLFRDHALRRSAGVRRADDVGKRGPFSRPSTNFSTSVAACGPARVAVRSAQGGRQIDLAVETQSAVGRFAQARRPTNASSCLACGAILR